MAFGGLDEVGSVLRLNLRSSFRNLPSHKLCYEIGHNPYLTLPQSVSDEVSRNATMQDVFGLTPFHILALSSRPIVAALNRLR